MPSASKNFSGVVASSLAISVAAMSLWTGCGFTTSEEPHLAQAGTAGTVLGYNSLRARIFEPRCISCHGSKGGVNLETYHDALSALSRIGEQVVAEKSMPPREAGGPLSDADQALIQAWVNAGGPENDIGPAAPGAAPAVADEPMPIGPVSYSQVRDLVFQPKCVHCHGTKGGVNLESYESVISVLDKVQREALVKRKMPPKHPLTNAEQAWLRAWIDENAPEETPTAASVPVGQVSYAQVRDLVFVPRCVKCHGHKGGVNLESYDWTVAAMNRVEEEALVKKKMPPHHPLGDFEQAWLKAWLDEGGPQNAPGR